MANDLIGISLLAIVGSLLFISYYLILAGWRTTERRLWPPWRMPTEWKLAGSFFSMGILKGSMALLVFGTANPIPAWFIAICVAILFFVGLLWGDFARPLRKDKQSDDR